MLRRPTTRLNAGQRRALAGLGQAGVVTVVQGPPGTGKSAFISATCLARVPQGARILACTSTNKVRALDVHGMTCEPSLAQSKRPVYDSVPGH